VSDLKIRDWNPPFTNACMKMSKTMTETEAVLSPGFGSARQFPVETLAVLVTVPGG
jgi:hypothetical protein